MRSADVVRTVRQDAGLSLRALARAAGVATSTVHRIERGGLEPTVDTLERIVEAAGARLRVEPVVDSSVSAVGLARAVRELVRDPLAYEPVVRRAAEFAQRFRAADDETRRRMIAAEPPSTGDPRWDAFIGGLVEWLAVSERTEVPEWTRRPTRFLERAWWVTPMESLHAWEFAGTPVSLQRRGVYIHRDSLTNV
jgi:transcriptional regulator with XRE-family HTH domain